MRYRSQAATNAAARAAFDDSIGSIELSNNGNEIHQAQGANSVEVFQLLKALDIKAIDGGCTVKPFGTSRFRRKEATALHPMQKAPHA